MESAARGYACRGWRIFPIGAKDMPLVKWGREASADPDVVGRWWRRWPDAGIGLACLPSRIVVIDLDGVEGRESWSALSWGTDHGTRWVTTGRVDGGEHLYFTAPDDAVIPCSAGRIAPGIDVRGAGGEYGGYAVLPPTVHASGKRYFWRDPGRPIQPFPEWLIPVALAPVRELPRPASIQAPQGAGAAILAGLARTVLDARQGERRRVVFWAACRLGEHVVAGRVNAEQGVAVLLEAAAAVGIDDPDLPRQVANGLRQSGSEVGGAA